CRLNARHTRGHGTVVELAAFHALSETLGGLIQALIDGGAVDILHQDRHALRCRLISNTAAHDTGAEYGSMLHITRNLAVLFAFFLDRLVIQDQSGHGVGFGTPRKFDEAFGFLLERAGSILACGHAHALDDLDRRRIHALGLGQYLTLGGFEHHGG